MDSYDRFSGDYHEHFCTDPNARLRLGVERDLDRLPDPSLAAMEARLKSGRALQRRLAVLRSDETDFDRLLDLDLAALSLEAEQFEESYRFNDRNHLQQDPSAGDDIGDGIFQLLVSDPRAPQQRVADIVGRLEAVPAYLDALIARLDRPLSRWVAMEREQLDGLPDLFANVERWATGLTDVDRERLGSAVQAAVTALQDYDVRLAAMPSGAQLHLGADIAQQLVHLSGIDATLDELHQMARDFLAEIRDTLGELRGRLCRKYGLPDRTSVSELHRTLKKRFRPDLDGKPLESILDLYREAQADIVRFIRARDLFPMFADQDIRILRTPGFLEPVIPAGAMDSPAPFRAGTRVSTVYLTLSEELIDEHSRIDIPNMMIHEGTPGHHLQLATAATHESIIRRHYYSAAHSEGWTTMLEDYMLDIGYMGELTDEARLFAKRDIARIGARVAIDLFFMSGDRRYLDVGVDCDLSSDDPFVAAGALLQEVTGFTDARLQGELNWYSRERAYPLSYLAGNRAVWTLKGRFGEAQKGRLDSAGVDREFHRVYLQSGNMPLSFLTRVFQYRGLLS